MKWISLKERKPEHPGYGLCTPVLIYVPDAPKELRVVGAFFNGEGFETDEGIRYRASHWMPMPTPPGTTKVQRKKGRTL
jgi:lipoprotein-anchoring transpeptidase ErfK/SrfK